MVAAGKGRLGSRKDLLREPKSCLDQWSWPRTGSTHCSPREGRGGRCPATTGSVCVTPFFLDKHATWSCILLYLGWQFKYQQRVAPRLQCRTRSAWACLGSSLRPASAHPRLGAASGGLGGRPQEGDRPGQSAFLILTIKSSRRLFP